MAAQLSIQKLFADLLQRRQLMNQQFFLETAGMHQENVWPNYMSSFTLMTFQLLPLWVGGSCVNELIKVYTDTRITYEATDAVVDLLYSDAAILRLEKMDVGNCTPSNVLIRHMYTDIDKANKGASLVAEAMSLVVSGYYSGGFLMNANANNMIIYSLIFHSITHLITQFLATNHHKDTAALDDLVARVDNLVENLRVNALIVTQEDRATFMHSVHRNRTRQARFPAGYKTTFGVLMKSWSEFKGWANFLYNHMIIFKMMLDKTISRAAPTQVLLLASDVVNLASWQSDNSASSIEIRLALGRMREFIARMKSANATTVGSRNIDYSDGHTLHREYQSSPRKYLCLNNFSVGIKGVGLTLTRTEDLCVYGPIVAVTGASGGGKSTALQIISGIKYAGSRGNGTIVFGTKDGKAPIIITVGQDISITPHVLWLEDITSMLDPAARVHEQLVRNVIAELRVDAGANVNLANSLYQSTQSFTVSGGHKKKISVARALIKTVASKTDPDIVILDEPFIGLDDDSIIKMQGAIKKYWPDSMVFVVDHKAEHIPFAFQVPGSSAFGLQSQSRTLVYDPSTSPLAFLPGFLKCFGYNSLLGMSEGFYDDRLDVNNATKRIEFHSLKNRGSPQIAPADNFKYLPGDCLQNEVDCWQIDPQ